MLRPGGWFAASDWLIGHDGPPSPEMAHYIACEALDFGMASPGTYRAALAAAGFLDIALVDRNPWYREVARAELDRLRGPGGRACQGHPGRGGDRPPDPHLGGHDRRAGHGRALPVPLPRPQARLSRLARTAPLRYFE